MERETETSGKDWRERERERGPSHWSNNVISYRDLYMSAQWKFNQETAEVAVSLFHPFSFFLLLLLLLFFYDDSTDPFASVLTPSPARICLSRCLPLHRDQLQREWKRGATFGWDDVFSFGRVDVLYITNNWACRERETRPVVVLIPKPTNRSHIGVPRNVLFRQWPFSLTKSPPSFCTAKHLRQMKLDWRSESVKRPQPFYGIVGRSGCSEKESNGQGSSRSASHMISAISSKSIESESCWFTVPPDCQAHSGRRLISFDRPVSKETSVSHSFCPRPKFLLQISYYSYILPLSSAGLHVE